MAELTALQKLKLEAAAGRAAGSFADSIAKTDERFPDKEPQDQVVNLQGQLVDSDEVGSTFRTFVHQVAGANTILPSGKRMTFAGKTGSNGTVGYYMTDIQEEIDWMVALVKIPSSQITELIADKVTHTERLVFKQADPAIAQAAADAAKNTEAVFNPATSAAVDNLGNTIAKESATPMQVQ